MARKRFTEREVIACLLLQGTAIVCCRCGKLITISDVPKVEREHFTEIALGGADDVSNCGYSHGDCHATITNGTKATTAGSSKQRIAKTKRLTAETAMHTAVMRGDAERPRSRMQGRWFQQGQSRLSRRPPGTVFDWRLGRYVKEIG